MTDHIRKPISKRLRFEILRRDNHQCRYCGRSTPEVQLTVDHVVPVTLGGGNEPTNLAAACRDCNSGKSSVPADAALVDDVEQDAMRWVNAMRQASAEITAQESVVEGVLDAVSAAWGPQARYGDQMPDDWAGSVVMFFKAGLSQCDLLAMVTAAFQKQFVHDRWAYFCGCCWKRLRAMQDRASGLLAAEDVCEPASTPLSTIWTVAQVAAEVEFAKEHAEGVVVTSSVMCRHADPESSTACCDDPICQVRWAAEVIEFTDAVLGKKRAQSHRDEQLMDELDHLEVSLDG